MLKEINREESGVVYRIEDGVETAVNRYVLTTPETISFEEMLAERFPEIDAKKFANTALKDIAEEQSRKLTSVNC